MYQPATETVLMKMYLEMLKDEEVNAKEVLQKIATSYELLNTTQMNN